MFFNYSPFNAMKCFQKFSRHLIEFAQKKFAFVQEFFPRENEMRTHEKYNVIFRQILINSPWFHVNLCLNLICIAITWFALQFDLHMLSNDNNNDNRNEKVRANEPAGNR